MLAFCVFEVMIGMFWPSMMAMRAVYVPEDLRSTILNTFRIPLNLFVCLILFKVGGWGGLVWSGAGACSWGCVCVCVLGCEGAVMCRMLDKGCWRAVEARRHAHPMLGAARLVPPRSTHAALLTAHQPSKQGGISRSTPTLHAPRYRSLLLAL